MSSFKIYGSSAGSGKTFTLTKTYLQLLLNSSSTHYFKQILAITFTNDAASEMKARILDALKELGNDESKMSSKTIALWAILKEEMPEVHPLEIQKRAKASFEQILQDYSDFNVKTIDSFTNQLVSSFSLDLGLPYNYEVVLDKKPLLLKAVERVFDKIGVPGFEHLSKLIENYALEQADEGKNWQMLVPNLAAFANNIFNDQYYALIQKNEVLAYSDYLSVKKNINASIKIIQNKFLAFGEKGKDLLEQEMLKIEDFAYGKSGFASIFLHTQNVDSEILNKIWEPKARMLDAINNDKWYTAKAPEEIKSSIDKIKGDLSEWFNDLVAFLIEEKPKYLLFQEMRKNLDNLALLSEVSDEFGKILHENDLAYITDFNRRINKVVANEPVPYIFERLGEKYNHILIDEFQDTSDIQYFNLLPLIENALAKNHFNMLVGDPKQSIYRFRGGKVELMIHVLNKDVEALHQNEMLTAIQKETIAFTTLQVEKENLEKNYRSKKEIISFNNLLFTQIAESSEENIIQQAFENKTQAFHEHSKKGGHVELNLIEDVKGEDPTDELTWTLKEIERAINRAKEQGFDHKDMAILCRKTKGQAAEIAEYLTTKGYPVISSDSLLLKNKIGISFLISLLKAYQDPKSPTKSADAILLYFRYNSLKMPTDLDFRDKELTCWTFFETLGIELDFRTLGAFGLHQLTESFANKMGMFEDAALLPYLFALLDVVQNHIKKSGNSLSEFLALWEQNSKTYALSTSNSSAITVSTIHKSKGLEYPVVIIPFANWSLKPNNRSTFWVNLEEVHYQEFDNKLKAAPLIFKKDLAATKIVEQYERELEFNKLEALNVLYVVLTRPVDRLYIIAKKPAVSPLDSIYPYLRGFAENHTTTPLGTRYIFAEGNKKEPEEQKEELKEVYRLKKINSRENLGRLKLKSSVDRVLNEQNQRDKGNIIHSLFSEIKKAEDLEQALQQIQFEGLILDKEKDELREDAIKILEHPELKHLFSGDIRVENERDILQNNAEISRPDRVVLIDQKAIVIDYKTGRKRDTHLRQIKHYGELYRQMGFKEVEMLIIYLSPLQIVRC